jgi:hypothetical protein
MPVSFANPYDGRDRMITRTIHQLVGKCTDLCYNVSGTIENPEAKNYDRHSRSFVGGANG